MVEVVDLGIKVVASMLGECTNLVVFNYLAEVFGAERSVANPEEILLLNVKCLGFVSRIGRSYPLQVQVLAGFV